jgi:hypothetical protein
MPKCRQSKGLLLCDLSNKTRIINLRIPHSEKLKFKISDEENKTLFEKMDITIFKPTEELPNSPPDVEKEIKASYVSHFSNRVILSDQAKDLLHERFLLVLEQNPEYIDSLLYFGKYNATTHLPANCTHKPETCDNCRDNDTDFYMDEESSHVLVDLWKSTYEFMGEDEEDSDKNDSGEDDENDEGKENSETDT